MRDIGQVTTPTVTSSYTPTATQTASPVYTSVTSPSFPVQKSSYGLAVHVLELSLVKHKNILAGIGISDPLKHPSRTTPLPAKIYDSIKDYATKLLRSASVPFSYQTVKGQQYVVEKPHVLSGAISYVEKAFKSWGYIRSTATPATPVYTPPSPVYTQPSPTPVYTQPYTPPSPVYTQPSPTPVYTQPYTQPSPTPVYTQPYTQPSPTPAYTPLDPVYTPPAPGPYIPPSPAPAYTEPYTQPAPEPYTKPSYTPTPVPVTEEVVLTQQRSPYQLALHALEASLFNHEYALSQIGISDPLSHPSRTTALHPGIYDSILVYAKNLLEVKDIPFNYMTVDGDPYTVQQEAVRANALNYVEKVLTSWGYIRGTGDLIEETPAITTEVEIGYPTTEIVYPTTAEIPYTTPATEVVQDGIIEESIVVQWAVSRSLLEHGISQYPILKGRLGVSRPVYDSLINRAMEIADIMIEQNTYAPQL